MTAVTLTLLELAGIVGVAVALAAARPSAISQLAIASLAQKLGLKPSEVSRYEAAVDDSE
jgi:hypothetical protein